MCSKRKAAGGSSPSRFWVQPSNTPLKVWRHSSLVTQGRKSCVPPAGIASIPPVRTGRFRPSIDASGATSPEINRLLPHSSLRPPEAGRGVGPARQEEEPVQQPKIERHDGKELRVRDAV